MKADTSSVASKRKVLHLITKLEFGGAQQNTLHTVEHLNPDLFEVFLASGKGAFLDEKALARIPKERLSWLRFMKREIRPWWDFIALLEVWLLLKRLRPQIIHTHSSKAGIIGRWAAWLAGVPVIIHTFHGFGFHEFQPPLVRWIYVLVERWTGFITTAFVFVSRRNMEYAERCGLRARKNPELIRSGISIPEKKRPLSREEKEEKRRALGLPAGVLLAAMVGNLKPQKNPGHFIELARRLQTEVPEALFLFIGGTENQGMDLNRYAQGNLPPNLLALGWRPDAAEIVGASDLFVLTSLWEGLPRSAVEALVRGVPVCAYDTDGVSEIVQEGKNGYLAKPNDIQSLTLKVKAVLMDASLRASMAETAASSISMEFDINNMVFQQEALYKSLLNRT